jgi:hypothetical protein
MTWGGGARRSRGPAAAWLAVVCGSAGCDVYEGRSLDLFAAAEVALECRSEADCQGERSWCARGACVQCLVDADCPRATPACAGNVCVQCSTEDHCAANQRCNTVLETCALACSEPSDCAGQAAVQCSNELDLCVECLADADCTPRAPECSPGGLCVQCVSGAFCPENRPACEPSTQRCVECTDSSQCGGLVCDVRDARCVECLRDADCAPLGTCDPGSRRCRVPCGVRAECEPKKPICDDASGLCIECTTDVDCLDPNRRACTPERQCAECTSDAHCLLPDRPACISTQRCAECSRPEHCPDGSTCDLREARCVPPDPGPPTPMSPMSPAPMSPVMP